MKDLIKKCIDMDEWKHSRHNKLETSADFIKAQGVIEDKIEVRKKQIECLEYGLHATNKSMKQCKEYEDLENQDDV